MLFSNEIVRRHIHAVKVTRRWLSSHCPEQVTELRVALCSLRAQLVSTARCTALCAFPSLQLGTVTLAAVRSGW